MNLCKAMNLFKASIVVFMMGATGCAGTSGDEGTRAPEALAAQVQDAAGGEADHIAVLVHGAFADASSWGKVITGLLQPAGYTVVAVQDAMTSFDGDVATTERVIEAQAPPRVVVVAHSYGGMVVGAAARRRQRREGQGTRLRRRRSGSIRAKAPTARARSSAAPPLSTAIKQDASGFLSVDPAKFDIFASDVPAAERNVLAATQRPILGSIFDVLCAGSSLEDDPVLLPGRKTTTKPDQPWTSNASWRSEWARRPGWRWESEFILADDDLGTRKACCCRRGDHPSGGRYGLARVASLAAVGENMKASRMEHRFGPPKVIELEDIPAPRARGEGSPGPGRVGGRWPMGRLGCAPGRACWRATASAHARLDDLSRGQWLRPVPASKGLRRARRCSASQIRDSSGHMPNTPWRASECLPRSRTPADPRRSGVDSSRRRDCIAGKMLFDYAHVLSGPACADPWCGGQCGRVCRSVSAARRRPRDRHTDGAHGAAYGEEPWRTTSDR